MERKKFSELAWNVTEPQYREDPAYSYSILSTYLSVGFNGLSTLRDKKVSPSLTFGSMVDTLLTDGQEAFDERFFVAEFPALSDQLVTITNMLFTLYSDTYQSLEEIPDELISSTAADQGYYKDPKYAATRVKKVRESCTEYFNTLILSAGKEVVTNDNYLKAVECVDMLRNDEMTMPYFSADTENIEHYYQLKFKGEYENIPLRCMADLIIVNHTNKTVLPCDLKTSSTEENEFPKAFVKWHYWIQAQLYWYLIRNVMDKDPIYKDYKLLNYRFIVIDKETMCPLVWQYDDTQSITDCTYGKNNNILCRNWRSILKELHYYDSNKPRYPQYIKKVNSVIDFLKTI